ncbi:MAG: transglycosylase domain-containing protein, partial [Myxococcales bacterium]|nr:transglycosylase domain-containing protein [Myxococcales bacterium]
GMDLRAIARAALSNLQAGGVSQGGSTITQQLAKMFVGQARTYERKFIELLVARQIEGVYTKQEILEAYLNRIYLGAGVTGVRSAARIYFDHSLDELTLDEVATIAGVASAPSAFDPYSHPERARTRRDLVLARMGQLGFASSEQVEAARALPIQLRERGELPASPMPYVTDEVRLRLEELYGHDAWRYGSIEAVTSINPVLQAYSGRALNEGTEALDHRQGFRGPLRAQSGLSRTQFDELLTSHYSPTDRVFPALVQEAEDDLEVYAFGEYLSIPRDGWRWAAPFDEESSENSLELEAIGEALAPGDVVLLERTPEGIRLTQPGRIEAALVSMDLQTGYMRAMGGGTDYEGSQFNRATRGCRQPGSTFKPVIFSRALARGMSLATPLLDVPLRLPQSRLEIWRPRNADRRFQGHLSLRDALIRSRNLPTIAVFKRVGLQDVMWQAENLGITTEMQPTDALSLGASCVLPTDMATVYGVFGTRGMRRRPVFLVSAVDGNGRLLHDQGVSYDAAGTSSAMIWRALHRSQDPPPRVLDERTAYLMTYALHDVIEMGTGYRAAELEHPSAGKTGTTNAFDAWFVGYTERLVTVVWVGTDRNTRPLGDGEHGAEVALPIWLQFMRQALDGAVQASLTEPRPEGVNLIKVDLRTGLLAQREAPGAWLPFAEGTEPTTYAPSPDDLMMERLDSGDDDF